MFGTMFDPRTVPMLFGIVVVPAHVPRLHLLPVGAARAIRWLQILVLVNPLVYMSEGFRAALTAVPHMSLLAIYPVLIGFTALFTWVGVKLQAARAELRSPSPRGFAPRAELVPLSTGSHRRFRGCVQVLGALAAKCRSR